MQIEKVDDLIRKLNNEIVKTQRGVEKSDSLFRLKDIAKTYRGEDRIIPFSDLQERIKASEDELKIMTGWTDFDKLLRGFRLQQLVVVSALTSSGKTSFLMDMTVRLAEYNPLWFAFEESADELVRKFLERGQEPPLAYTPENMINNTVEWLESKIVESIAKYDTKVVFIDQLDFIVPMTGDNHHLNVAKTMRDLKGIAKKWNVVIFIICHLTKAKLETQPTLEDLRGSASIGQESDTVILLWRESKREAGQVIITDNVNVSIQKNRRYGKTGNIKMIYDNGKFLEQDWVTGDEMEAEAKTEFKNF